MTLNTIFEKPVDRHIEGVIKADDDAGIRLEVEEYVLTNEIEKRLENFLSVYNNYEGANGVWVSGFFGSGKSHLLKMLALLLENRDIEGTPILDLFLPKCGDNQILKGDLKKAVSIPSRSILFNIDQKADVISKTQIDALLSVFVKVFDEMCGYYGKQGHIAKFERDLDDRGCYDVFKDAFKKLAGMDWEQGREQALLEATNIAQAYAEATGGSQDDANGILDKYRSEYKVSIEDFAEMVNQYVNRQGPDFRLNFFVDEVGQYIADNVKLMTNLQTVAESLATKCKGRAWVIVTAQEALNSVIGDMDKQGLDFSKIQDRFANRMKLTSADVSEVIQKRLLMKNSDGVEQLSGIFKKQVNNFKTLFDFADGSQTYRNFQGQDHFNQCYPFIPYQFTLFQKSIQNLSDHGAFEGKHSSVGERSMLAVFQQVVLQIRERDLGELATFDYMFEGIRTALKSQIQQAIITAEQNLDNPFAIRVLKALFLVKYVKEFKPTLRNLSILMMDSFERDIPGLHKNLQEALNLLEQQTYIQRNGELYEFLTNEEKDVEQEIKNTEIESTDAANELGRIIFDQIIRTKKIRYDETKQDYSFSRKLDDRLLGREYELSIHVITPYHENASNEDILKAQSMARPELLVVLPVDDRLIRDIDLYKKTEKYVQQNMSLTQQESIRRILTDKSTQNSDRYSAIKEYLEKVLESAKLIFNAQDLEISESNVQSRITKGFHEIISRVYTNLRMLRGNTYTEADIAKYLEPSGQLEIDDEAAQLSEAEQEMLGFIQASKNSGSRPTLKSLMTQFEKKPYGWYFAAVLCILAKLCARGKIDVLHDSNILQNQDIEKVMLNTSAHANVILEPQIEITASQIRKLKEFYEGFFDKPPEAVEGKALAMETAAAFKELKEEISSLASQADRYHFLKTMTPHAAKLGEFTGKQYSFYYSDLTNSSEELLDLKEQVLGPVRQFMSSPKKAIFDEAGKYLKEQKSNFSYIDGDEVSEISTILEDPECYKGNKMHQVKQQLDALVKKVAAKVVEEIKSAEQAVEETKSKLMALEDYSKLEVEQQEELLKTFDRFKQEVEGESLLAVIRDRQRFYKEDVYRSSVDKISSWLKPAGKTYPPIKEKPGEVAEKNPEIDLSSIKFDFKKAYIETEEDIRQYTEALKQAITKELRANKRVRI